jgi:hypothetical protein
MQSLGCMEYVLGQFYELHPDLTTNRIGQQQKITMKMLSAKFRNIYLWNFAKLFLWKFAKFRKISWIKF